MSRSSAPAPGQAEATAPAPRTSPERGAAAGAVVPAADRGTAPDRGTATEDDAVEAHSESGRYLTFVLGGDVYALDIFNITEIIEFRNLTVVPMMPDFIRGVINLRGRVVPVVDMAARFGRGTTQVARRTSIIIVEAAGFAQSVEGDGALHDIGVMVDAVNEVVEFGTEDIEPPPVFGAGIRADFISGMAKRDNEFIIVLDVSHVLSIDEMVTLGKTFSGEEQVSSI